MMLRLAALLLLLCSGLAQAAAPTVLQRPIDRTPARACSMAACCCRNKPPRRR